MQKGTGTTTNISPFEALLLFHNTHQALAVETYFPLTGSPPSVGPWRQWQKDPQSVAGKEKVLAEALVALSMNPLVDVAVAQ